MRDTKTKEPLIDIASKTPFPLLINNAILNTSSQIISTFYFILLKVYFFTCIFNY